MIPKYIKDNTRHQFVLFDMDGVVAEYRYGEGPDIVNEVAGVYQNKRPIMSMVNVARKISHLPNKTVGILSSCEHPSQIIEKKNWLAKYMPFIKEENIMIVCWNLESYTHETRCIAKLHVIQKIKGYDDIYLIEDTHQNIKATNQEIPNCAHHLSEFLK